MRIETGSALDEAAVSIKEFYLDSLSSGCGLYRSHCYLNVECSAMVAVGSIKVGRDNMVGNISLRGSIEVDIAMDAAHVPCILTFQIGTVVIAHYLYGDIILASMHYVCQIKLGIGVSSL